MAARTGLTLVKKFTYRGDPTEEFSNRYHFKGLPPGDSASWTVLMNDLVDVEKNLFASDVSYSRAYGYDSDDPAAHHVFAHDFTQPGPPPTGIGAYTGQHMAGDQAACVEWATDQLNGRGKIIYLRKYFHSGWLDETNGDNLEAAYLATLESFANGIAGFHGGLTAQRLPYNVVSHHVIPWSTTRTLKRRGKRPLANR